MSRTASGDGKRTLKIENESRPGSSGEIPRWVPSRYNVRATTDDGRLVLWNTMSSALNVFKREQAAHVQALLDPDLTPETVDRLLAWKIASFEIRLRDADQALDDVNAIKASLYNLDAMACRHDDFVVTLRSGDGLAATGHAPSLLVASLPARGHLPELREPAPMPGALVSAAACARRRLVRSQASQGRKGAHRDAHISGA